MTGGVQPGQDQHPAAGQPDGQLSRGGQPVGAGQADVQQRHVRPVLQCGWHDLVTGRHRDGHLDVRLQAQQRNQRVSRHADVLGDQDADHRAPRTARASGPGATGR